MDRVSENAATVPETGVGVLDKAMVAMRVVSDAPRGLAELQASTGLPRATAHRLASALEAHGLLRRDASGRFELGHGLVALGQLSANRFPLVDVARPVATALRDATGEAVQVFVREGSQRRCVLSLESAHGLRWIVPEGSLLPIEVGSSGRLLEGEPARNGWMQSADGAIIGALSVSGPVERLTKQPGKRFGTMIVAAASEIRL
jgi:DNA-binding IclR family transcriptional regulator